MLPNFKKTTALIVVAAFSTSLIACAGGRGGSVKTAANQQIIKSDKKYDVRFASGQEYRVKGCDLDVTEDKVGVRFGEGERFRYYSRNQIEEISRRKYSGAAMGIGAAVGAVVGGGLGAGLYYAVGSKPTAADYPQCDDAGDCAGMAYLGNGIALGFIGALVGAGAGVGIGAAISKKKQIIVAPHVNHHDGNTSAGVGISGSF